MPFTQNDLQQAIGAVFIQFWSVQKQLEETQAENAKLKEDLAAFVDQLQPKEPSPSK